MSLTNQTRLLLSAVEYLAKQKIINEMGEVDDVFDVWYNKVKTWMENIQSHHVPFSHMNRLIMNYFVTEGFKEEAEKFQEEAGIKPKIDLGCLNDVFLMMNYVKNNRIMDAISRLNETNPGLLEKNRQLLFHLQKQHLIKLIRDKEIEAALDFAQMHLAQSAINASHEAKSKTHLPDNESSESNESNNNESNISKQIQVELDQSMMLLAYDELEKSRYSELLHERERQKVARELNVAVLKHEQNITSSRLSNLLKLVLWAQEELNVNHMIYPQMDLADCLNFKQCISVYTNTDDKRLHCGSVHGFPQ